MPYTKLGEKLKQEPVCMGPLEVKRVDTDVPFIIGFGVFIVVWIAISTYAFCAGDSENFFHPIHVYIMQLYKTPQFFYATINEARYIVLGFFTYSGLLLFIFAILLRWATRPFVITIIVLTPITLILLYGLIIHATYFNALNPIIYLPVAVLTVLYGFIIYAIIKAGIKIVCKVIKESCKAVFFFPSTLIFAVIQFSLQLLVAIFASSVCMYLLSIRIPKDSVRNINATFSENEDKEHSENSSYDEFFYENTRAPFHIYLFHVVNFCGFLWVTWFVMGLGRMVLTATFTTWYQAKDKNSIPLMIIPECFMMIVSYHTGTIAYASSPLSVIPMFFITWKHGLDRLQEMYKQPILILTWLTILLKFSFDAITMCANHGGTFYKSAKASYILFMKHPVSYLAMNAVTEYVIVLGTLLLPALSLFSVYGYCMILSPKMWFLTIIGVIIVVTMTSLLMSLTFFMVFRSASNTIRYCYLEDSKVNNEAEMKLYEILVDDAGINAVDQNP